MNKFLFFTVEDFAEDTEFIRWALNEEKNPTLDHLYEKYDHLRQDMDEAIEMIRFFEGPYNGLNDQEIYDLWKRIKAQKKPPKRPLYRRIIRYAAFFIAAAVIGVLTYSQWENLKQQRAFFAEQDKAKDSVEFKLTLSDGRQVELQSDTARIQYSKSGTQIQVDSRQIKNAPESDQVLNKLSIPFGKRSHITLADGSEIWINSGSELVYPSSFDKSKRTVYLKGEAYFDVKENENKPFTVRTSELDIEVLGTRFNVNSYGDNSTIETVLEEGQVQIEKRGIRVFQKELILEPSQKASFSRETKEIELNDIEPKYYTSWKDGYLLLKDEKLEDIVKKLTRIYNKEIEVDEKLSDLRFSGKLDLRETLKKELDIMKAAYPINYTMKDNRIKIQN